MDTGLAAVAVALITTVGGIIVGFMQAFKKEAKEARVENRLDHQVVQAQLKMIHTTVNRVDDRLEKHIDEHREGNYGKTVSTDRGNAS
jgi:hypothetical protein